MRVLKEGQARQGDVLIETVDSIPKGLKKLSPEKTRDGVRTVLAHGEATGHAHAIYEDCVTAYAAPEEEERAQGTVMYLAFSNPAPLKHEEHHEIKIENPFLKVTRQREYTGEDEWVNVAD